MNTKYYVAIASLLTALACTGSIQHGTAPDTGSVEAKRPVTGKSGGAKSSQDTNDDAIDNTHRHDTAGSGQTDTKTDAAATAVATPPPPPPDQGAANTQPTDPNVVEFTIPAGTGRSAWNTPSNPIRVKQGQTLVIKNADSSQHWVHTNFTPFPHPFSGIAPGASVRYRINGTSAAGVRDHLTGAPIYMTISR